MKWRYWFFYQESSPYETKNTLVWADLHLLSVAPIPTSIRSPQLVVTWKAQTVNLSYSVLLKVLCDWCTLMKYFKCHESNVSKKIRGESVCPRVYSVRHDTVPWLFHHCAFSANFACACSKKPISRFRLWDVPLGTETSHTFACGPTSRDAHQSRGLPYPRAATPT